MSSRLLSEPVLVKAFNLFLAAISFGLTALGLEIDVKYVALVIGSTFAGSLLLGFFRPEKSFGDRMRKIGMAQVAGLIFGSVIVEWRGMVSPSYIAGTYCTTAMVALIFLRSLVGLTESNAGNLTTTLIQRIFNVKLSRKGDDPDIHRTKGGTRRRTQQAAGGVHISQSPDGGKPTVKIDAGARPDEVRIVEETVIENQSEVKNERS